MKFTPKNRNQWRTWLQKNHAAETEVWLVFLKQHTGKSNVSYNDAVEEALCFGWIDGVKRSIDNERYMHRFSPRKAKSKWSDLNRDRARRMLKSRLMAPAGKRTIEQAKQNGEWAKPGSTRPDLSMPLELSARLKRNKKAEIFFTSLAPSYQRQYISWVATAKREETRQHRAEEAIALLGRGEKLGMR